MRAKAVVVSLFLALLVGASGALALDSQTAPPDYTPVPQEATEGVTSTPVATVLLVQDLLPWGSSANTDALTALGVSHVVINSADLAATDLSEVHVVMYASDQPTTYYQNIAAEIGKITDFVSAGGVLLAHACDRGWNRGTWDGLEILPGGAHHVSRADNALQIVQALHPVVAGLSDADLSGWGSSTHGYLTDLPGCTCLIVADSSGDPAYIRYWVGYGRVLATMQTVEHGYEDHTQQLLLNELSHAAGLIADFTADVTSGVAPLTVSFTDLSTGPVVAHCLDFGDGSCPACPDLSPTFTYTTPGVYDVRLEVCNGGGYAWDFDYEIKTGYITVLPPPPEADFTADVKSGPAPLTVHFTSLATGDFAVWCHYFGDGTFSWCPAVDPTYTYTVPGIYDVGMTVCGPGGRDCEWKHEYITVSPANWYEDNADAISYANAWTQYDHPAASAGHLKLSGESTADTATFTFHGTGITWRYAAHPSMGIATVQLDAFTADLDLYSASPSIRTIGKTGLPLGSHTLTIRPSGAKNPSATGYGVNIDALQVTP